MEHKGNAADATDFWYLERPDLISSVAYWYQSGEPASFGGLPTWAERRVPWEWTLLLPLLRRASVEGAPPPAVDMHGLFGMRPSIKWAAPPLDGLLSFPFTVRTAGRYAVRIAIPAGPQGGVFDILLDGGEGVRGSDLRLAHGQTSSIGLGEQQLEAGTHRLTFRSHGKGDLIAESVRTLLLPPKATLSHKRPDHEGHFVRLAIGRAVYAHRLMEDALPRSLQALVDAGLLESRFLRDENNQPLRGGLRGSRFHVEGPAWKHEWEGIDARH
jgi:hypothetical protein